MRRFLLRLFTFLHAGRAERELAREVAAHLAILEEEFLQRGFSPDEARSAARRAFGSIERAKEQQRDARSFLSLEDARRDLRYAGRALRRSAGFTAAAVATLAAGIGASTAIFSVAYGVSLRPLPYPAADRLIRIYEAHPTKGKLKEDVSLGAFHDWREGAASLEVAAIYTKERSRSLTGPGDRRITMMGVSPAFFEVLGARPMLGQGFKPEREYTRFTTQEVVLSYGAWQRLFGGRRDVIGQVVEVKGAGDNDRFPVVGVMPAGFEFTEPVDAWYPEVVEVPVAKLLRQWRYDRVIARMKPDASIVQARAELEAVAAQAAREFPSIHGGWTVTVESLHESIVGSFGRATWLLLAAVGVVLLVTCFNVVGLLIARAVARERETSVRIALGAGGWRLTRLWLAEAGLLAIMGASFGWGLAWLSVSALKAAAPPGIPRLDSVALDWPTLLVACASTLLCVALFTVAPLRGAPRRDLLDGLRAASANAGERPARHAARAVLTAAQCAGAACLVVLALLLTRSFQKMTAFDLGWNANGVLSEAVSPPMPAELRRPWFRYVEWSDRLIGRLEATPGVERAAITTQTPFSLLTYIASLARGRHTTGDQARWPGVRHVVSDGYFDVMRIRLTSGRTFGPQDRFTEAQHIGEAPKVTGVAIVSESTARALWPGRSPLGEALWLADFDTVQWREVIGVVDDIQFHSIGQPPALHVFVPWTQSPTGRPQLLVRGTLDARALTSLVRSVVEAVEPGTSVEHVAMLDALVARATAQPRFTSRVVGGFSVMALLIAAVGIYGMLSYVVAARTREIGIRLALGASGRAISTSLLVRGVLPAIAGGAVGAAVAVLLARVFRAMLFETPALDAQSLIGGALLLMIVAALAAAGPAIRAARVDPVVALRTD